jgi:hypothetical protein
MGDWKPDGQLEISGKTLYLWIVTEEARKRYSEPAS